MTKTYITLNEDQKEVLMEAMKGIHITNSHLHHWVNEGTLTSVMAGMMPSLIESHFAKMAEILDYDSPLAKKLKEQNRVIQKANRRIQTLEKQIGSEKPVEGLAEQLGYLRDTVNEWWRKEGFSHISEEQFTPYGGLKLEFGFMLERRSRLTDVRNKEQHIQHLRDKGFEFADFEESENEKLRLVDTEQNRKLLLEMLKERFPSIQVFKWENRYSYADDEKFVIWYIEAIIHHLADI